MKPFTWKSLDPSEIWPYVDPEDARRLYEEEVPELSPVLGPASNSPGRKPPSPFDITAPGFSEIGLASVLNWAWRDPCGTRVRALQLQRLEARRLWNAAARLFCARTWKTRSTWKRMFEAERPG